VELQSIVTEEQRQAIVSAFEISGNNSKVWSTHGASVKALFISPQCNACESSNEDMKMKEKCFYINSNDYMFI